MKKHTIRGTVEEWKERRVKLALDAGECICPWYEQAGCPCWCHKVESLSTKPSRRAPED